MTKEQIDKFVRELPGVHTLEDGVVWYKCRQDTLINAITILLNEKQDI